MLLTEILKSVDKEFPLQPSDHGIALFIQGFFIESVYYAFGSIRSTLGTLMGFMVVSIHPSVHLSVSLHLFKHVKGLIGKGDYPQVISVKLVTINFVCVPEIR